MRNATNTHRQRVGQKIREARLNAQLSHDKVAAQVGTSRQHLIKLEKGLHMPSRDMLDRIAVATGKAPEFFDDEDEEEDMDRALLRAAYEQIVTGRALLLTAVERQKRKLAPLVIAFGLVIPAAAASAVAPVAPMVVDDGGSLGECRQGEYQQIVTAQGTWTCIGPAIGPWFWHFEAR